MQLSQIFKSKTINTNLLIGAIFTIVKSLGVEIPNESEIMTAVITVVNIILRFMTKKSIKAK